MIDYDNIKDKFISVAREAVGSSLSQTGPNGNDFASVIRRRPEGPFPDYPYITFDVLDTSDEQGWLLSENLLNNDDNPIFSNVKMMLLNYRCYGGNSINIINNLHSFFKIQRVRDDIRQVTGGSVVEVQNIDSFPIQIAHRFLESASFNLIFNIEDTISDTDTGVFDSVDLDGELARHEEDPDPLDMKIIAP